MPCFAGKDECLTAPAPWTHGLFVRPFSTRSGHWALPILFAQGIAHRRADRLPRAQLRLPSVSGSAEAQAVLCVHASRPFGNSSPPAHRVQSQAKSGAESCAENRRCSSAAGGGTDPALAPWSLLKAATVRVRFARPHEQLTWTHDHVRDFRVHTMKTQMHPPAT